MPDEILGQKWIREHEERVKRHRERLIRGEHNKRQGQKPLHFRAMSDYRCPIPTWTTDTEAMPKSRFLGSIARSDHP